MESYKRLSSKEKHTNAISNEYTYERLAIHAKIIADVLYEMDKDDFPYLSDQSKFIFTGGPPASGKNTILSIYLEDEEIQKFRPIIIDPDEIKKMLPEYIISSIDDQFVEMISDFLHIESGDIAWKCFEEVLKRGNTLGIFVVTLSDIEWSNKMISLAKTNGFEVELLFTYADLHTCEQREADRKERTKRGVPIDVLRTKHYDFSRNFGRIAAMGDYVTLFDNSKDFSDDDEFEDDTTEEDNMVVYKRIESCYFHDLPPDIQYHIRKHRNNIDRHRRTLGLEY